MIRRQRRRSPSHRHQSDRIKRTHHLQPQRESQLEPTGDLSNSTRQPHPNQHNTNRKCIQEKDVRNRLTTRKISTRLPKFKISDTGDGIYRKTPEYKACLQFIQAISPKHKLTTASDVIDLTSPTEAEDETMESNDILFVNTKDTEMKEMEDKQPQNDEEHGTMDDNR